jgi:hypothetical protein
VKKRQRDFPIRPATKTSDAARLRLDYPNHDVDGISPGVVTSQRAELLSCGVVGLICYVSRFMITIRKAVDGPLMFQDIAATGARRQIVKLNAVHSESYTPRWPGCRWFGNHPR